MATPNILQRVANINLLQDPTTNAIVGIQSPTANGPGLVVVVGATAPSNNDGYPNGTIYIQTV